MSRAEKAAEEYAYSWRKEGNKEVCELFPKAAYRAFIAGAEWQKKQMPMPEDTVLFQKGVEEGRRLEREKRKENKRKEDELPRFYGD